MSSQRSKKSDHPLNNDMLVRGIILVFIGLILIIAPYYMAASPTRDLFIHARIPAWFALVLGGAFIGKYGLYHYKKQQSEQSKK